MKALVSALLLATVIIGSGCATQVSKVMDSWIGKHEADLISSWGQPSIRTSDGQGGKVLLYGNVAYSAAPQQNGYQRTRMFYVDPDGRIYSSRWQGL
jgi:hypothetical protein